MIDGFGQVQVLDVPLSSVQFEGVTSIIVSWAKNHDSRYICIANVHMLMEAYDSPAFKAIIKGADLVVPDGMPLVWMMRLKGRQDQQRVYGPGLMLNVLETAAREDICVGFYGGKPGVLETLVARMEARYEGLRVAYSFSPPFHDLTPGEDDEIIKQINEAGVRILFVGLGCPKQEIWMSEHLGRVRAVMIGVGAAFDFHAGTKPQAPAWMQTTGLEWLFRFGSEPRRLWKRYLHHNPRFVLLAIGDLLHLRKFD